MNTNNILTIAGLTETQISLESDAVKYRDKLVSEAAQIATINDAMDADAANAVLRDIHNQLKAVEEARKKIKQPVDELAKKIQDTAKGYCTSLEEQKARLSSLLGTYQRIENDKAEAARRKAIEDEQRIAAEQAAKVAAAEAAHGTDSPQAKAAADVAVDKLATVGAVIAAAVPQKLKGASLRKAWKFEVTDINALMKYSRDLVTIEANTAAINAVIKNNQDIPGLRVWEENKTTIR